MSPAMVRRLLLPLYVCYIAAKYTVSAIFLYEAYKVMALN